MLGLREWTHSNGSKYGANDMLVMLQVKESPAMEPQSLFDATSNPNVFLKQSSGWGTERAMFMDSELLIYT